MLYYNIMCPIYYSSRLVGEFSVLGSVNKATRLENFLLLGLSVLGNLVDNFCQATTPPQRRKRINYESSV